MKRTLQRFARLSLRGVLRLKMSNAFERMKQFGILVIVSIGFMNSLLCFKGNTCKVVQNNLEPELN